MTRLRIALTGAQGTGKSTLARALLARLRAVFVGCDVRSNFGLGEAVSRGGAVVGEVAGADTLRAFVRAHLEREALVAPAALQLFDRCLLDTLAYAEVLGCLPPPEFDALVETTRRSCAAIDMLVWLRITGDYPVLTAHDESPAFRRAIERSIQTRADTLGLRLHACALETPAHVDAAADALAAQAAAHTARAAR